MFCSVHSHSLPAFGVSRIRSADLCTAFKRPLTSAVGRSGVCSACDQSAALPETTRRAPSFLRSVVPAIAAAALLTTPLHADAVPNSTLEATTGVVSEGAARNPSSAAREAFFDINVDGQSAGRIVVSLFDDVPIGAQRFMDIADGQDGISYQLSKIAEVGPSYIRVGDLQSLSYAAGEDAKIAGGDTVEQLEVELQEARHTHTQEGTVSLVVKDNKERPVKERLVAYQGKLVTVVEQLGGAIPNGSGWVVTTAPAPALDSTNLVVGHVTQGFDVVQQIAALPVVRANKGSPFLKVAKLAGDRRATVAEKSYGKPFKRVVIASSGLQP